MLVINVDQQEEDDEEEDQQDEHEQEEHEEDEHQQEEDEQERSNTEEFVQHLGLQRKKKIPPAKRKSRMLQEGGSMVSLPGPVP